MKAITYILLILLMLFSCKTARYDSNDLGTYKTIRQKVDDASCDITITLNAVKNKLGYRITGKNNDSSGYAEITKEGEEKYVVFKGLKFVQYDDNDTSNSDVMGSINNDTIVIQNYGNSMNEYTKLHACEKYLYLVKQ